jgi:hypothetical protein
VLHKPSVLLLTANNKAHQVLAILHSSLYESGEVTGSPYCLVPWIRQMICLRQNLPLPFPSASFFSQLLRSITNGDSPDDAVSNTAIPTPGLRLSFTILSNTVSVRYDDSSICKSLSDANFFIFFHRCVRQSFFDFVVWIFPPIWELPHILCTTKPMITAQSPCVNVTPLVDDDVVPPTVTLLVTCANLFSQTCRTRRPGLLKMLQLQAEPPVGVVTVTHVPSLSCRSGSEGTDANLRTPWPHFPCPERGNFRDGKK